MAGVMTHQEFLASIGQKSYQYNNFSSYKSFDEKGHLLRAAARDKNGNWHDTTELERARLQLEEEKAELEKRKQLEILARQQNKNGGEK